MGLDHDRRHDARVAARDLRGRIRHGHGLVILNISAGGALVEAGYQLRPGARIDIYLDRDEVRRVVGAIVSRCAVASIDPREGIVYRAGLCFTERCNWLSEPPTR